MHFDPPTFPRKDPEGLSRLGKFTGEEIPSGGFFGGRFRRAADLAAVEAIGDDEFQGVFVGFAGFLDFDPALLVVLAEVAIGSPVADEEIPGKGFGPRKCEKSGEEGCERLIFHGYFFPI
ncbi:hypothetical protein [Microvirga massiliensis]|uniref:hypothetical protein n=1 Tax=Microvirga massiliensis TaxID=1033741 RepID=UPI0011C9E260|nr:hypothetical protein [Microvirga massiliensis]